MKKLFGVLAVAGLALTLLLPRASAMTYTLSQLQALGGTGVTVGALTFYNFSIGATGLPSSGFDPNTQSITFNTSGNCVTLTYNAGFQAVAPPFGQPSANQDLGFTYYVKGPGINYSSASGIFSNTLIGTLGPSDLLGSIFADLIYTSDLSTQLADLTIVNVRNANGTIASANPVDGWFAPQNVVRVKKDLNSFLIGSGYAGVVGVSNYQQTFCYVPEPGTVALFLGLGVSSTLLVVARRRRK